MLLLIFDYNFYLSQLELFVVSLPP
jgi:hypothetical protein